MFSRISASSSLCPQMISNSLPYPFPSFSASYQKLPSLHPGMPSVSIKLLISDILPLANAFGSKKITIMHWTWTVVKLRLMKPNFWSLASVAWGAVSSTLSHISNSFLRLQQPVPDKGHIIEKCILKLRVKWNTLTITQIQWDTIVA